MNNKHYLGKRVSAFDLYDEIGPITGVALIVQGSEEDMEFLAEGSDTSGYVLEIPYPYSHQGQLVANTIFQKVKGKTYKGFRATGARFDPLAELGDGVTANGVYSVMAYRRANFGPNHTSEVAAPGENAVQHEYSPGSGTSSEVRRLKAEAYSLISKTADEIRLEVAGKIDEREVHSLIQTSLEGIRLEVAGKVGETEVKSLIQTTLNGITLSVTNGSTSSTITLKAGSTEISSQTIEMNGFVTVTGLSGGTTTIDGSCIKTGTISAARIDTANLTVNAANITGTLTIGQLPGTVATTSQVTTITNNAIRTASISADQITSGTIDARFVSFNGLLSVNSGSSTYGYIGASTASSLGGTGAALCDSTMTTGVLAMTTGARMQYKNTNNQIWVSQNNVGIVSQGGYYYFINNAFYPEEDFLLGTANRKWGQIYSTNSAVSTSDREEKNTIEYEIDSRYDALWDLLKPCTGKYNKNTSDRTHMFLISQDVEEAIYKAGLTSKDFAAFIKSPKEDKDGNVIEGYRYGLRYEEFIPLCIRQIQKLQTRVLELEGKVNGV